MSVIVSALVWQHSKSTGSALLVALALADRSSDEGVSYPGVAWLAGKARLSERSVQYALVQLRSLGELVVEFNEGPKGCNLYRIMVHALRGADFASPQSSVKSGAASCTQFVSDPSLKKKREAPAAAARVEFDFEAGIFLGLTVDQIGRLQAAYPATNVDAEVLRAALWLVANPANRKSNYLRFLTGWMNRAQDRARPVRLPGTPHATSRPRTAADKRDDFTDALFGASRAARGDAGSEPPGLFGDVPG